MTDWPRCAEEKPACRTTNPKTAATTTNASRTTAASSPVNPASEELDIDILPGTGRNRSRQRSGLSSRGGHSDGERVPAPDARAIHGQPHRDDLPCFQHIVGVPAIPPGEIYSSITGET
ncbi:hypothetical protein [Methanoculleus sp. 10]|uniref:hypothetical protein n=1 Tax=Methanoculleus sp. 10 TaxID=430615 RepID=UPI0025F81877|nr:hypothetical protein [Methanoculleus sp. 10]